MDEDDKDDATPNPVELCLNGTQDFKSLTDVIGGHGPWQFRHWLVFLLATLLNVLHLFSVSLLFHEQCLFKDEIDGIFNDSSISSGNTGKPQMVKPENCTESACWNSTVKSVRENNETFISVTEQCSSKWIVPYAKCIYVIGCVLSLTLVRPLTLRYGRRPVSLVSCTIWMASCLATTFAHASTVYLVLRFIATLGIVNIYLISLMSLAECLCQEYKFLYILCGHLGWGIGHFFLPLFVWMTGGWLGFHIILCIGSVLLLALLCFVPESVDYYAKRGLWSRANKTLKIAAISNGYSPTRLESFTHNWMLLQEKGQVERRSFQIRNYMQVLKLVILFFSSFMTTFLYLIYTYRADWIKGRIASNFALMGTSEVTSVIILLFATTLVSVKYLWAISSAMASILMFITYSKLHSGERTTIPTLIYLATVFFAASSWILLLLKSTCSSPAASKWSRVVLCIAICVGAFAASSMEFKVAMVEVQLSKDIPQGLLITFCVCTTLLVAVHMLALLISTCILPHIEAVTSAPCSISESPHERLHYYIETAWAFSTVFGILLFLLEIAILCWVKFFEFSFPAAWATTVVLFPVVLLLLAFAIHFYRTLVAHKFELSKHGLRELECLANRLQGDGADRCSEHSVLTV